jgi:hypothetical protein
MCNLYSITTNQAAIIALFRVVNRYVGNLPPMPGVFPDYSAPVVVRNAGDERELIIMRWGMPPPPRTGGPPVTNIRNTSSPHWRGWLRPENRCLIPANSFAEYAPEPNPETKTKFLIVMRTSAPRFSLMAWSRDSPSVSSRRFRLRSCHRNRRGSGGATFGPPRGEDGSPSIRPHPTWIFYCQKTGHVFLTAGSAKTLKEINLGRCGIGGERFLARVRSIVKVFEKERPRQG